MRAVATISKLLSSAVLAARQSRRPYIISMGAAMSSTTIATAKGTSFRPSRCSVCGRWLIHLPIIIAPIPMPAPRYRNAATIVGGTADSSIFDTGVLTA